MECHELAADRTSPFALVGRSPSSGNLVLSWFETDLRKKESLRVRGWKGLTKWCATTEGCILEREFSNALWEQSCAMKADFPAPALPVRRKPRLAFSFTSVLISSSIREKSHSLQWNCFNYGWKMLFTVKVERCFCPTLQTNLQLLTIKNLVDIFRSYHLRLSLAVVSCP